MLVQLMMLLTQVREMPFQIYPVLQKQLLGEERLVANCIAEQSKEHLIFWLDQTYPVMHLQL